MIPWKHFGRKNVGFLYAIIHGAKASWEIYSEQHRISGDIMKFKNWLHSKANCSGLLLICFCSHFLVFLKCQGRREPSTWSPKLNFLAPICLYTFVDLELINPLKTKISDLELWVLAHEAAALQYKWATTSVITKSPYMIFPPTSRNISSVILISRLFC